MGENQREQNGAYQDAQDNFKRGDGADFKVEKLMAYHLHTNEAEQQTQTIAQEIELVGDVAKQEEEGTQTHDGEDVGEEDDVGVGGDGEDGGDAVDGKDDVGELDDQ